MITPSIRSSRSPMSPTDFAPRAARSCVAQSIEEQHRGRPAAALALQLRALGGALVYSPISPSSIELRTALLMSIGLNRAELEEVDAGLVAVDSAFRSSRRNDRQWRIDGQGV